MKNKKVSSYLVYPILVLIYTIYYVAMRSTPGVLTSLDKKVCFIVGIICFFIIIYILVMLFRNKKEL